MAKKKKKTNEPDVFLEAFREQSRADQAVQFLELLESNEECMGEGAAMAVTCEVFGMETHEGYELLADHPNAVEITL